MGFIDSLANFTYRGIFWIGLVWVIMIVTMIVIFVLLFFSLGAILYVLVTYHIFFLIIFSATIIFQLSFLGAMNEVIKLTKISN